MAEQNDDYSKDLLLSDIFTRAVRYWWLVTILMIAGGVAGLLIALLQKPLYESTAHITTAIDFAYAGRLTDYEEDFLLAAVGDIITSDAVIEQTSTAALDQGLLANPEDVASGLVASRQGYRWQLSSRFHEPQTAQKVNQLWLESSLMALEKLRQQSITALAQVNAQSEVEACFQQAVSLEPVSPYCTLEKMRTLIASEEGSNDEALSATLLNRLLISRISFQVTQEAGLPVQPSHYGANITTLAGILVGLLAALILFLLGYPRIHRAGSKK